MLRQDSTLDHATPVDRSPAPARGRPTSLRRRVVTSAARDAPTFRHRTPTTTTPAQVDRAVAPDVALVVPDLPHVALTRRCSHVRSSPAALTCARRALLHLRACPMNARSHDMNARMQYASERMSQAFQQTSEAPTRRTHTLTQTQQTLTHAYKASRSRHTCSGRSSTHSGQRDTRARNGHTLSRRTH